MGKRHKEIQYKDCTSSFLHFMARVGRKFHCSYILYMILKNFQCQQSPRSYIDLSSISPDPANSCIKSHLLKKENIDVQIIVPVYNVEAYIEECINSILQSKTKYSYKVVIINDGSTDNTREKLIQYEADARVNIIDQGNKGFSGARNTGLRTLFADYVMFVDSDDRLLPNAIENMVNMAKQTNADIVQGSFRYFKGDAVLRKRQFFQKEESQVIPGFPWGKVYRAELWENICFPERYWFEDTVVNMIICPLAKKIITISDFVYEYRQNERGISNTMRGQKKSLDSHWVTKQLFKDRVTLNIPNDDYAYEIMLRQIAMNYSRIKPLGEGVLLSMFNEYTDLLKSYFMQCESSDRGLNEAGICIKSNYYERYKLWFEMLN